jgi:uncharacterized repeat protein (TIGR02543 family)
VKNIRNNTIKRMSAALGAALALILAACGGDGGPGPLPPPPPATCEVSFVINSSYIPGAHDAEFNIISPANMQVAYGQPLGSLPTTPTKLSPDYDFAGWYANSACTGPRLTVETTITTDATYYAKWLEKAGKSFVTLDVNSDSYSPAPVFTGDNLFNVTTNNQFGDDFDAIPVPTRAGDWRFAGWYDSPDRTNALAVKLELTTQVAGDVTYYARWVDSVAYAADNTTKTGGWGSPGPGITRLRAEGPASVRIAWNAALQEDSKSYQIWEYAGAVSTPGSATKVPASRITGNVNGRDVTVTGLTSGTPYYFYIKAVRNYTESDFSVAQTATPLDRAVPEVSGRTSNSFDLTWPAVPGATLYDVYINGTSNKIFHKNFRVVTDQAAASPRTYTHTATPGTTYYAWVVAKNATGFGTFAEPADTGQSSSGVPGPRTDCYTQRTMDHIEVISMPTRRVYDGTDTGVFNGVLTNADWAGLTIKVFYNGGEDPVEIIYDGVDSRFSFSTATFNGSSYSQNSVSTPGQNKALNATVTFTSAIEGASPQSAALNAHGLSADASRYVFVARLPVDVYFKSGATGSWMVNVPGATVSVNTSGSQSFGSASTFAPVTVASFKIAKYETTEKLYYDVERWATGSQYNYLRGYSMTYNVNTSLKPKASINRPTMAIFCNALSEMTGKEPVYRNADGTVARQESFNLVKQAGASGYRLPTTIEWEFTARGGVPSSSSSSNWKMDYAGTDSLASLPSYAVYNQTGSDPSNVGSKSPNSLDLYDMSGNIAERCESNSDLSSLAGGHFRETSTFYLAVGPFSTFSVSETDGFRLASD